MMALIFCLGIILLAALLSALFSGMETGLYAYDSYVEGESTNRLSKLLKHREKLVIACLIGTNLAVYVATMAFDYGLAFWHLNESWQHLAEIFVLTPFLFVVAEILPKAYFHAKANTLMPLMSWPLILFSIVFSPIIFLFESLTRLVTQLTSTIRHHSSVLTRKHLHWILQDQEGGLSVIQSRMVGNALELTERRVTSIMKPCKKVARVPLRMDIQLVKRQFFQSDFSFLIVYDRKPEQVLGIVYLNKILLSENNKKLEDYLVEIPKISYKESLTAALDILRNDSKPVGQVMGANEHVLGLVFTRQIIEKIVGELEIW